MDLALATLMNVTQPSFDPFKYSGAWYEVASHKAGFYGLGQYDCMDTRGIYEYKGLSPDGTDTVPDPDRDEIDVATQCRHLDGRISGIRGVVKCPLSKTGKGLADCTLRFPTAPYVPPATYRVLETDYSSYALVEGAGDHSFIQIYSRYPRPGMRFIEDKKQLLRNWGYDPDLIHMTPVTLESDTSST